MAELKLSEFIQQAWKVVEPKTIFTDGWHLHAICDHLEAVSKHQIKKLIINIPPRHMKSLAVSVFWPCWEWITDPCIRWVFASYAQSLSVRDSLKCRRLILSKWYQERWADRYKITGDQNEKMRFENDRTGYRISTSVDGVGTGEGGDRIVCIPEGYFVITEEGEKDIKDIVEQKLKVQVLSYNEYTNEREWKNITKWYTPREVVELIEIDLGDGDVIECTPNHPIWVKDKGYVKAEDLQEGDKLQYFRDKKLNYVGA